MTKPVAVAVGVIYNQQSSQVFIAKRSADQHQGDLWEFPGGKIEAGEEPVLALKRELNEELGIQIDTETVRPLIQIQHEYKDKTVLLDVYRIENFSGEPYGKENQAVQWVDIQQLQQYSFPEANKPILDAIRLPAKILITGFFNHFDDYCEKLNIALEKGIAFVQIRAPWLVLEDYIDLCQKTLSLYGKRPVTFIANCHSENFSLSSCHGLHLSSNRLHQLNTRPIASDSWLSAACHSYKDIQQAEKIGVDFIHLSPVKSTETHPEYPALGWEQFSHWVKSAKIPVFALGGMSDSDIDQAIDCGGQGIAAIGHYWRSY